MKKLEQNIVLLGVSIFDNGAYVRSNEMEEPFCSHCFEKDAQQQTHAETGRIKIHNAFKTEVLGIK